MCDGQKEEVKHKKMVPLTGPGKEWSCGPGRCGLSDWNNIMDIVWPDSAGVVFFRFSVFYTVNVCLLKENVNKKMLQHFPNVHTPVWCFEI